jgi:cell wall-associated NlpC family hydrolase
MVKNLLFAFSMVILLASCSSLRPLNFTNSKQEAASATPETPAPARKNTSVKFIDDISVTANNQAAESKTTAEPAKETFNTRGFSIEETAPANPSLFGNRSAAIENASELQLKYSILLNTEVEQLQNKVLLESVDEWYGTRYRLGGTTKKGIDCSAFVQAVFATAYGLTIPRTAREQYRVSQKISRTELQEGDLLFFNTTGGVSHVGIYLQNNKFIHASVSKGVTISDMFDPYYLKRFIGAGRVGEEEILSSK